MFEALRRRRRNREVVDTILGQLIEASRRPDLFEAMAVPDTVMGRFESFSIQVYIFLRRCRDEPALAALAQDVVDRFMTEIDASIRELGVGDQSVPKRMKSLAGQFYERMSAYDAALAAPEPDAALAEALLGRALPRDAPRDAAARLASYMTNRRAELSAVPADAILAGQLQPMSEP